MKRREISEPGMALAVGYAPAVELAGATRLLFLSGQGPVATDGTVSADIAEQTRQVWANLSALLAAAGMTPGNFVKVTVFLSDGRYRAVVNTVSDEFMGGRLVAWTTIIAGLVREDWLLEIEAIAAA